MSKFKIGDKVYCPSLSTEILTIHPLPTEVMVFSITNTITEFDCGFVKYLNKGNAIHLKDGTCMKTYCPKVVHATVEKHAMLEQLYEFEFEPPATETTNNTDHLSGLNYELPE